jgi:hypothetical protein
MTPEPHLSHHKLQTIVDGDEQKENQAGAVAEAARTGGVPGVAAVGVRVPARPIAADLLQLH